MTSRASLFAFLFSAFVVVASAACTAGGSGSGDCGANACGACASGFVNDDRCEGGEWSCSCVPKNEQSSSASTPAEDAGNEGSANSQPPVFTCRERLASPTTEARCAADDWDQKCEQGCLSCRCSAGTWQPCTTSASCFDGG